jgi:hypothetical protein
MLYALRSCLGRAKNFPPGPEPALRIPAISCISEALKPNISLIRLLPKNEPVTKFSELKIPQDVYMHTSGQVPSV